jgi:tRNA U54 and U55 pseudouridine synthase Pus10
MRMYRKARKLAYELREPFQRTKMKKEAKRVYRAYVTLEDQVGVFHLKHRVGRREELQTALTRPHEFRKVLVRVYRLKNLKWSLYHVDVEGKRARMPQPMQIIE